MPVRFEPPKFRSYIGPLLDNMKPAIGLPAVAAESNHTASPGTVMSADALHHAIEAHRALLHHYGYLAVFVLVLLEDFGLPAPSEATLIAASLVAPRAAS
jgi:hypothetical protein